MIADLRDVNLRRVAPVRERVGRDRPVDGAGVVTGRNRRPHDEPAVLKIRAAVQQLQRRAVALDRHPLRGALGRDHQPLAVHQGSRLHVLVAVQVDGPVGLVRERARLPVGVEGSPEQRARKQLQVESHPPDPGRGKRLVEIDGHAHGRALGPHVHAVGKVQIARVSERVEALAVLRRVRVGQRGDDLGVGRVELPRVLRRGGRPLPGRRLQPQVSVAGHADAVLDDPDPALMPLGVDVLERHHVQPRHAEVAAVIQAQPGRLGPSGPRGQPQPAGQQQARAGAT